MTVGVVCGDRYHPTEVIQQGLEPLQGEERTFDFLSDRDAWPLERMQRYPVIALCRGGHKASDEDQGWLSEATQRNFREFVRQGGGLLICHAGSVGYRDQPDFLSLTGGVFVHHPPSCPVTIAYLGETGRAVGDPPTFEVYDEHYFMETTADIHVFLHSVSENGTQPAGWTRQEGAGRVCVLTPGHFVPVLQHPVYQHTLQKALRWCAGAEESL